MAGLSPKQERFVSEYLIDLNATQAAIRAGYAAGSASVAGARLLANVRVKAEIERRAQAISRRLEITQERVLRELAAIAMSDPRRLYHADGRLKPPSEWDDETAAAISAVEVEELYAGRGEDRVAIGHVRKVKRFDKVRALELLGRHLRLFEERQAGAVAVFNIQINL
jgi:phage terminase small subunit